MVLQNIFMMFEDLKLVPRQQHRIGMTFEYQDWRSEIV